MLQNTPDQKTANPLKTLAKMGQSPWLDYINRAHTEKGELKRMVEQDGLSGMTSNPAIFEKTMGHGHAYDAQIKSILAKRKVKAGELYEALAVTDIQAAADTLRPVYDLSKGQDGHISIEVSPHLAHDTEGTIAEAHRLWKAVNRPNLMIKIPGTPAGARAIEKVTEDGLSTNVTLLFSQKAYHETFAAYVTGLEKRAAKGEALSHIASVASFYIGRVDLLIDEEIDRKIAAKDAHSAVLKKLRGKIAIANATLAYAHWQDVSKSVRWQKLAKAGANAQRLLWASTSTKDKAYSDVIYVDELIAPDTVNTMPLPTFEAFRDHGNPAHVMTIDAVAAREKLALLEQSGINLHAITEKLLKDGLLGFNEAFDKLHGVLEEKMKELSA